MLYNFLKVIHILSATLLFGTGLGSAFYFWRVYRGGEIAVIAAVSRQVVLADWLFTLPAAIIQLLTGLWMMQLAKYPLNNWIFLALVLYVLAGVCWLAVVWLQIKLRDLAQIALVSGEPLSMRYHRYMTIWFILGWPAFIALFVAFFLMVYKPVW